MKIPAHGKMDKNITQSPEYNKFGMITRDSILYNSLYYWLEIEFNSLGTIVENYDLRGNLVSHNFYQITLDKFNMNIKNLFQKFHLLRTNKPNFFYRVFNYIISLFTRKPRIYNFDDLIDKFFSISNTMNAHDVAKTL